MECSPPGSSVHGDSLGKEDELVAISFSRGSSQPGMEFRSPAWTDRRVHCVMVTPLGSGSIHRRTEEREPPEAALPGALSCAELVTMVALLSVTPAARLLLRSVLPATFPRAPPRHHLLPVASSSPGSSLLVQRLLCLWMLVVGLLWAL